MGSTKAKRAADRRRRLREPLAIGSHVEAQGLIGAPELNGVQGIVVQRQGERWEVHFDPPHDGARKALRPQNLRVLSASTGTQRAATGKPPPAAAAAAAGAGGAAVGESGPTGGEAAKVGHAQAEVPPYLPVIHVPSDLIDGLKCTPGTGLPAGMVPGAMIDLHGGVAHGKGGRKGRLEKIEPHPGGWKLSVRGTDGKLRYYNANSGPASEKLKNSPNGRTSAVRVCTGNTPAYVCEMSEKIIIATLSEISKEQRPPPIPDLHEGGVSGTLLPRAEDAATALVPRPWRDPGDHYKTPDNDPDFVVMQNHSDTVSGYRVTYSVWLWSAGLDELHSLTPGKRPPNEGRYGSVAPVDSSGAHWPSLLPTVEDHNVNGVLRMAIGILVHAGGLDFDQPAYVRRACAAAAKHDDPTVRFCGNFVLFHLGSPQEPAGMGRKVQVTDARIEYIEACVAGAQTPLQRARALQELGSLRMQQQRFVEAKELLASALQLGCKHEGIMPMIVNAHLILANCTERARDVTEPYEPRRIMCPDEVPVPPPEDRQLVARGIEPGMVCKVVGWAGEERVNGISGVVMRAAADGVTAVIDLPIYGEMEIDPAYLQPVGFEAGAPQARELIRLYLERATPCHANYAAACYDRSFGICLLNAGQINPRDPTTIVFDTGKIRQSVIREAMLWYCRGNTAEAAIRKWTLNPAVGQKTRARTVLTEAGCDVPQCDRVCAAEGCEQPGTHRCKECKGPYYCSAACQLQDWKRGHKEVCHDSKVRDLENAKKSPLNDDMWKLEYSDQGRKLHTPVLCAGPKLKEAKGPNGKEYRREKGEQMHRKLQDPNASWVPLTRPLQASPGGPVFFGPEPPPALNPEHDRTVKMLNILHRAAPVTDFDEGKARDMARAIQMWAEARCRDDDSSGDEDGG